MCDKKPKDLKEYRAWLKKKLGVEISRKVENHYNTIALKVRDDFSKGPFWNALTERMKTYHERYLLDTSYPLFSGQLTAPELLLKEFDSFLLKTFRNNVVRNNAWPDPPKGTWIIPPDWISQANDIVRTCFVVKYLDGVEFLIQALASLAKEMDIECNKYYVAGNDGYYAAHVYIRQVYEVPSFDFDTCTMGVTVELQITSQLQEVIRKLLHKHFEDRRKRVSDPDVEWQWNYRSDEFSTNYLGHILHYLEGMIMEVRDNDKKSNIGDTHEETIC